MQHIKGRFRLIIWVIRVNNKRHYEAGFKTLEPRRVVKLEIPQSISRREIKWQRSGSEPKSSSDPGGVLKWDALDANALDYYATLFSPWGNSSTRDCKFLHTNFTTVTCKLTKTRGSDLGGVQKWNKNWKPKFQFLSVSEANREEQIMPESPEVLTGSRSLQRSVFVGNPRYWGYRKGVNLKISEIICVFYFCFIFSIIGKIKKTIWKLFFFKIY